MSPTSRPRGAALWPTGLRRRCADAVAAVVVTALLVVLPATGAAAHSALEPREIPAGSATDFTLTIAHGCTPGEPPPDAGEEISPTIEVAVRFPVDARDVEPLPAPGWEVTTTREGDRRVVTWQGGEIPTDDIGTFGFTATLYGDEGDELAFEVFQGCLEGEYRWIEVDEDDSGDPLEQPAPTVVLTSSQPAPPEPIPAATAVSGAPATTEPASPSTSTDAPTTPMPAEATPTPTEVTAAPTPTPAAGSETPAADEGDSSGAPVPTVLAAVVVVALAGLAVAALRGRRG